MADFRPKKRWGQNFLRDRRVLESIVEGAGINRKSTIVEIGPGKGALTELLVERAGTVIAVEIDRELVASLRKKFRGVPGVKVVAADFLQISLCRLLREHTEKEKTGGKKISVVGNLPYYITTPIITHLLEERRVIDSILITVQKEVARRLTALPGGREYGAISVLVRFYTDAEILRQIGRDAFFPRPRVDSALVRFKVLPEPRCRVGDEKIFFQIVRAAFAERRKMIVNAFADRTEFGLSKSQWSGLLMKSGIDGRLRAERLGLDDFARLEKTLGKITNYKSQISN